VLYVCQVKMYINYLSLKSKQTTQKSHEENKFELNQQPNIDHIYFWQSYYVFA
jgi:hypothetical protein